MLKNLSTVRSQLMAIVLTIMISSLIVFSAVGYYIIHTDFTSHIQRDNEVSATELANNIRLEIQNSYNITQEIAHNSDVISFVPDRQKKALADTASRYPFFELLYIQKVDGNQTARSSGNLGFRGDRAWFKKFISEQKPYVSESYFSLTGNTNCCFSIYWNI